MKQVFRAAGVSVARGEVVVSLEQAQRLIQEVGYPVVAKPDMGVGAANTFKIADANGLEKFLATRPPVDNVLEEFVHGPICTLDGLTDKDGNLVFFSSLRYSQNIMETVNEDRHIYYCTLREIPPDLEEAGRRVLKAFDVRERFFHFEFFRSERDGRLRLLYRASHAYARRFRPRYGGLRLSREDTRSCRDVGGRRVHPTDERLICRSSITNGGALTWVRTSS